MSPMAQSPTFVAYAFTVVALALNLVVLWAYSGAARATTKTAVNDEDAKRFGTTLVPVDPPEVARVLRAHANAQANIVPFLFLGLVFVFAGGSVMFARIDFGVFVAARIIHSIVYVGGKQPWRTLMFAIGVVAMVALLGDVVWLLLAS
jgi:microsomal prostaglandin-E synthase 1